MLKKLATLLVAVAIVVGVASSSVDAASLTKLTPTVTCISVLDVDPESGFTWYYAHFGYTNDTNSSIYAPYGSLNTLEPWTNNGSQPTTFLPGAHSDVFQVSLMNTSQVQWKLGNKVAIATSSTPLCQ